MDETLLIRHFGDTPNMRIIDFFLDNMSDYSKKEILEGTGISKTTLYKVWPELERLEIVVPKRKYGNTTLYVLNEASAFVKQIVAIDNALCKEAMQKAAKAELEDPIQASNHVTPRVKAEKAGRTGMPSRNRQCAKAIPMHNQNVQQAMSIPHAEYGREMA